MAEKSPQDALYDHYGDMQLRVVDEPTGGKGLTPAQAESFLQRLKPVTRAKQKLGDLAKKVKPKG
jgi:hypothetical protein